MRLLISLLLLAAAGRAQILSGVVSAPGNAPTSVTPATDSPGTNTYSGAQSITFAGGTAGATTCWTTDGSTPAAAVPGTCSVGTTYSGAFTSPSSTFTLKWIGTKAGMVNSGVQSSVYTITVSFAVPTGHYKYCNVASGASCALGWVSGTGNTISIFFGNQFAAAPGDPTINDGQSTVYTKFTAASVGTQAMYTTWWGAFTGKPSAGISAVTLTYDTNSYGHYWVVESSGNGVPTQDVGWAATGDGTATFASGSLSGTPASASEIVFVYLFDQNTTTQTYTTPAGWTQLGTTQQDATKNVTTGLWYKTPIAGTPSTSNPSFTSTIGTVGNYIRGIVAVEK